MPPWRALVTSVPSGSTHTDVIASIREPWRMITRTSRQTWVRSSVNDEPPSPPYWLDGLYGVARSTASASAVA